MPNRPVIIAAVLREASPEYRPAARQGPRQAIPERLLAQLWQQRAARHEALHASGGRRVRVLFPGRPGRGPGPDFRDALVEVEGLGLVQGDVEIHVRQEDWDAHGHGRDRAYSSVVLHAALEGDGQATALPSGQSAPMISLKPLLEDPAPAAEPWAEPVTFWQRLESAGYAKPDSQAGLEALLDRAGDARFQAKSNLYLKFLQEQTPDQVAYEGLMEALGYRRNQQPFVKLAMQVPYAQVAQAARQVGRELRVQALQGWLEIMSGLAKGPAQDAPPSLPKGWGSPLRAAEWHLAAVRPANHPLRRLAGAAVLLARFLDSGLAAGLAAAAACDRPQGLVQALRAPAFAGDSGPACIGPGRAADLAVNVALPCLRALAQVQGQSHLEEHYWALYRAFGKLEDNELIRAMTSQLAGDLWRPRINSARRQQGLLHLNHLLRGGG
ncbi:MAG: DUF2851 family protein [SAR202 cluster bacterium]|nr:DUF2851 family protein [SAR202 cluster bacterium]